MHFILTIGMLLSISCWGIRIEALYLSTQASETESNTESIIIEYLNDVNSEEREIQVNVTEEYPTYNHNFVKKILSRSGYFLRIRPDGRVDGTSHCKDRHVDVITSAVGPNLFIIRGADTGLYLSMNKNGKITARNNTESNILSVHNFDILWRGNFKLPSCFVSFQSLIQFQIRRRYQQSESVGSIVNSGRFLALTKHGRVFSSDTDNDMKNTFIFIS